MLLIYECILCAMYDTLKNDDSIECNLKSLYILQHSD